MAAEQERVCLLKEIKRVWLPEFGPIAWPNVEFQTPQDSRWAEVYILDRGDDRVSLGRDYLKRHYGSLQVNFYSPKGIGSKENRVATDYLGDCFESLQLLTSDDETIEFHIPEAHDVTGVQERQEGTNENWFRRVLDCPFYRDSRKVK